MKRIPAIISAVIAFTGCIAACNMQAWGFALLLFAIWTACSSMAWKK